MHRGWIVLVLAATPAAADPIVDRNFAIELYDGVAIGDTAQVGMGGAGAAVVVGSAGTLLDAAAPAVRPTTDRDSWSWDYHFDFLTGKYSSDYDNNGTVAAKSSGAQLVTAGLAFRRHDWAIALTVTNQSAPLVGSTPELGANALRGKFVVARWFPSIDVAIGIGLQTVSFSIVEGQNELFSLTGAGGLAGATYVPRGESFRASLALETAAAGTKVETATCDPMSCHGYILPSDVEAPARVIVGGAYRLGPTAWNQLVATRFRDERTVTIAADLVATGTSPNANGIEAFGMQQLQPSGRRVSISLRGGADFEALPGRLRVRAGSYWEPGRFDGVSGRLHGTFGIDVRVLEFELWGLRRGRISGTADLASEYRNLGVSVGFWH